MTEETTVAEKLLYKVVEAADAASVSRSTAYELVRSGEWPSIRVGSRIRVVAAGLHEWLNHQMADPDDPRSFGLRFEEDASAEPRLVRR
jgi:excisionase family DNA binding protein